MTDNLNVVTVRPNDEGCIVSGVIRRDEHLGKLVIENQCDLKWPLRFHPPLNLLAKRLGLNILTNVADLDFPYPQLLIESTERFNRQKPQIVKRFLI